MRPVAQWGREQRPGAGQDIGSLVPRPGQRDAWNRIPESHRTLDHSQSFIV